MSSLAEPLESLSPEAASPSQEITPLSFSIERNDLLKTLAHLQSVVERRNTIAILANVKIEASNDRLLLSATDMDISISEEVVATVNVPGSLTLPAHTLYDIVRKLPDGSQISFVTDEKIAGRLNISCQKTKFTLASLPAEDFPVLRADNLPITFLLSSAELAELFDKTRFAISTEETRYYLNGVYLHLKTSEASDSDDDSESLTQLAAVATDGHRLATVKIDQPEGTNDMPGIIIPRKTVLELKKLLDERDCQVTIALSDKKISFELSNITLISKLIDGTFPDYQKVIPVANDNIISVPRQLLVQAVDRIATIASDKSHAVRLIIENNAFSISASNEDSGTGAETLDVEYQGPYIDTGFNARYLLEMLNGLEGEYVQLAFSDGKAPAIIRDSSNAAFLSVIMPMRI